MEIVQQSISHFLGLNILTDTVEPLEKEDNKAVKHNIFKKDNQYQ